MLSSIYYFQRELFFFLRLNPHNYGYQWESALLDCNWNFIKPINSNVCNRREQIFSFRLNDQVQFLISDYNTLVELSATKYSVEKTNITTPIKRYQWL
jgi:hypothetical protein